VVTNAVVAIEVELSLDNCVGAFGEPVNVGELSNAPPTPVISEDCSVTTPDLLLKLTTPLEIPDIACATNAVVASLVELSPAVGVGAVGVPVNTGLTNDDPITEFTNEVVAIEVELSDNIGVGAVGLPVNVGEFKNAPPTDIISSIVKTIAPVLVLNDVTPSGRIEIAVSTYAVVANIVLLDNGVCVGAEGVPVNVGLANIAPPTLVISDVCNVIIPVRALNDDTPATLPNIAFCTYAVVAILVELSDVSGVVEEGVPEKVGLDNNAKPNEETSDCCNVTDPVLVLNELTVPVYKSVKLLLHLSNAIRN
jgi:hypothetical protein